MLYVFLYIFLRIFKKIENYYLNIHTKRAFKIVCCCFCGYNNNKI